MICKFCKQVFRALELSGQARARRYLDTRGWE
jgi:hypothetical protein